MQTLEAGALSETIRQVASASLPTHFGEFRILGFERDFHEGGWPHRQTAVALIMGDLRSKPPLVRIHSQCLTGEVFGSLRCDCGQQLQLALSMIAREGAGILIYEQQEGRGIGLLQKLQAYELQDLGCDTVEANQRLGFKADYREYILPVEILKQLGVRSLRLLSNNPDKVNALENSGIRVVERVPCEGTASPQAARYLKAKQQKLRQLLSNL